MTIDLLFLGTSDAFHAGGRAASAILARAGGEALLVDCGPTTLARMKQEGLDATALTAMLITHFHGDHTFGLPFIFLDAAFKKFGPAPPLSGPVGTREHAIALAELAYPSLLAKEFGLPSEFTELAPGAPEAAIPGTSARVRCHRMDHQPESLGYRLAWHGKVLAFTGDTRWTDEIVRMAEGADLLVCECTTRGPSPAAHASWEEILANLDRISAKRIVLNHRGEDMLDARALGALPPRVELATDGLRTTV